LASPSKRVRTAATATFTHTGSESRSERRFSARTRGNSSAKGGSSGTSNKYDDEDDDKKGSGGGTNGLTGQATSVGCSLAGPPGGTVAGGFALAGLAALLARATSGRKRRRG
jgi:hypothetical protein